MNDETARILLEEFRAFRTDISEWKQETGERITAIETAIKPAILGNGQPSRMTVVESRCTALEQLRWRISGIGAAVGSAATVAVELLIHLWPGAKH
jgi:hypothetical protein